MAISRVPGYSLLSDLDRQGVDIQFSTNSAVLTYYDFTNFRFGINTNSPQYSLDVNGNTRLGNLTVTNNAIVSQTGTINLGSTANINISGGNPLNVLYTDGSGNLHWGSITDVTGLYALTGNTIPMGTNSAGTLVSNAVSLTTSSTVTDSIAQLNQILGKLVPPAPPNFSNNTTISINNAVSTYKMCNFTQTDNTANSHSVAGGTIVSAVLRVAPYSTTTVANVGPGSSGIVTTYLNGIASGATTLTGSSNGTYSNLVILNNQDYHNVVSSVTAGFWYSFSAYAAGSAPVGWNDVNIRHAGVPASTNTAVWYYDSSAPGTPTYYSANIFINSPSLTYSSTIPHYNSSTTANIGFSVNKLSGDMYPNSTNITSTTGAGGAFAAPTAVTYTAAGVTAPLAQNLYVSSGNAVVYTSTTVIAGFGSSSTGPSVSISNSYNTGTQSFAPGNIVLYKTGTANSLEETSIAVTSVGTGSGNAYRILNPGSTDTPIYTGTEAAFNSQTSPLQTYDATIVAGTMKYDVTNYSTGYWPTGPNLSTQGANQYFTFKFVRTIVSKFDIVFTGTIAGLWVSLPGSTIDSTSSLNGWVDMSIAYAGAGIPGANTGPGGNGSNGCSLGGVVPLNSAQSAKAVTATFGTVSSSSTVTNEIYIRIKFTSGQTLTALSIAAASH